MPMTPIDKKLYDQEVERIRKAMNLPADFPIFILDVDVESADWIAQTDMATPETEKARAMFRAANNREEGGE